MRFAPDPTALATKALLAIHEHTLNDTGPETRALDEAMFWLDANVSELAGTERIWWLVPVTVEIPLIVDKITYNLLTDTSAETKPEWGIQFVAGAYVRDVNGNRYPIEIVRRHAYEELGKHDTPGKPTSIWVSRLPGAPTVSVHPVPAASTTYVLELYVQTYASDIAERCGGEDKAMQFSAAWTRWAIFATAADIGGGPVRMAPNRQELAQKAEVSRARLLAWENHQHKPARERRVAYQDWG